jgi:hypothetical protein
MLKRALTGLSSALFRCQDRGLKALLRRAARELED